MRGPGNDRGTGFVVGNGGGGSGETATLPGRPVPKDGIRRRYDRETQSGYGSPNRPSDYALGNRANEQRGTYGYNQAADLGIQPSRSRQIDFDRRPSLREQSSESRQPRQRVPRSSNNNRSSIRGPVRQAPRQVQHYRMPSRTTSYDDWAPVRQGGYRYGY